MTNITRTVLLSLLLFFASCKAMKSHALETGIAGTGGAVGALVGGPPGIAVFGIGCVVAALTGEMTRPESTEEGGGAPQSITVNGSGNTINTNAQTESASWFGDWKLWFMTMLALVLAVPRWRSTLFGVVSCAWGGVRGVAHNLAAGVGAKHTRPPVQPRKIQDTVLDSVLPQPQKGDT